MTPRPLPCDGNTQASSQTCRHRAAQRPHPDVTQAPQTQCVQNRTNGPPPPSTHLAVYASISTESINIHPAAQQDTLVSLWSFPFLTSAPVSQHSTHFFPVKEYVFGSPCPMFPCPSDRSTVNGLGFHSLTRHQYRASKLSPLPQYLRPPIISLPVHTKETFKNTNLRTFFLKSFRDSYHPQHGQCLRVAYNILG